MTQHPYHELFEKQSAYVQELRAKPIKDRIARLKKLRKWILNNKQKIYDALAADLKKSERETDIFEIYTVTTELTKAIANLHSWSKPQPISSGLTYLGTRAKVLYEPKGVCLIIAPWNFPFQLVCSPLVSCLAAGNTAILKPSEHTPTTSGLICELVEGLFEPHEVVVIEGGVTETQSLLALPFDHIFFTGSTKVGKIVMQAASKNLTSVTLELGGKSPTIIDETADLKDASRKITWGKFVNCGQTCVAPNHIFVHENVAERFTKLLMNEIKHQFADKNGKFNSTPQYPRLISQNHLDKLKHILHDAQSKGGELIFGGQIDPNDNFMEPTIVSEPATDSILWQDEIFGPILPIRKFNHIHEVLQDINQNPKALALYLFTTSKKVRELVAQQTSSGSLVINDVVIQYSHPNLPFGGVGASGFGRSHGFDGFKTFSNHKSVLRQRIGLTNARLFYPPYTSLTRKLVNLLHRFF